MSTTLAALSRLAIGVLLSLSTAAGAQAGQRSSRTWMKGSWTIAGGVTPAGGQIGRSDLTAYADQTIYLFDYTDHTLKAFTLTGQLKWRLGREGTRPGEFQNATSLAVDRQGRIWVCDPLVGRVTIVSASGGLVRTLEGMTYLWRAVPRDDGSFWGLMVVRQGRDLKNAVRLYDSTGTRFEQVKLPSALDKVSSVVGTTWMNATRGNGLAITYLWSDRFVIAQGKGARVHEYRGIEHREFPKFTVDSTSQTVGGRAVSKVKIDPAAIPASIHAAVDGDLLYILFGTGPRRAPGTRRTVDAYRLGDGQYVGSYLLPEDISHLLVRNELFIGSVSYLEQAIRVWKWVPEP